MQVRIVEVGPRDGLQNEALPVPLEVKLAFINELANSGIREIEATSFVSPKWVPQLADADQLWPLLPQGPLYSALVPNIKGLGRATELGVERIALFTAASDAFTEKNINMTVAESLEVFREVIRESRKPVPVSSTPTIATAVTALTGVLRPVRWIRGYVSTAFQCPYSGAVAPERVLDVCRKLLAAGVDELSLGDTIGVAAPPDVSRLTKLLLAELPTERIAFHFHDTRGTAIANISAALDLGITAFDSSAGGLGGCPYAPGAGGNVATEDLVYLLERWGLKTGIDSARLAQASLPVLKVLGRPPSSKVQLATLAS